MATSKEYFFGRNSYLIEGGGEGAQDLRICKSDIVVTFTVKTGFKMLHETVQDFIYRDMSYYLWRYDCM